MAEVLPGGVIVYYVYSTAANQEWFGGTHDACERDKLRRGGGRNQWILMYSVMCPMMSYDSDVS